MKVACSRPPDLTENCSGIWLLFHVPNATTVCLKSSCELENIYWQRLSTKPAASVNITSDIVPHNSGDFFTGAQTDTNIGGLLVPFEKKYRSTNLRNCIIGHLNINRIRYKFVAVQSFSHGDLLNVFVISESKLDASLPYAQFKVTDVLLHRKHMDSYGGGIVPYMISDLPHRHRWDPELVYSLCLQAHSCEFAEPEQRSYRTPKR